MREMKDSGIEWIGEIPKNWSIRKLKYLAYIVRGGSPRPIDEYLTDNENGFNWIKISDTKKGYKYIEKTKQKIIPEGVNKSRIVHKGDLLLTNSMSFGEAYILNIDGCIHDGWVSFSNYKGIITDFLYYFLSSELCYIQFKKQVDGGVVQNLNIDKIGSTFVFLPSIEEQHRIAEYLDKKCSKIDEIISKQQTVIEKLKEYKLSIITEAVTKGLNPDVTMKDSGVEWIGEIPEHWEIRKLKSLVSIISKGTTPSTLGREIISSGKIRFLKAENIQDNIIVNEPKFFIDEETDNIMKRSKLQSQDILFVIAGATIGKTAIVCDDILPANTNQAVSFIRLKNINDSKYIWYYLQSNYIKVNLNLLSVQSAQPNLSMQDMGNFQLCYPDERERISIVNYLDSKCEKIDFTINKKQKLIDKLTEYKKSLIYEVVTGKKEV